MVWSAGPTSAPLPIDTGADTYIVLIDAPEILFADGGITLDVAEPRQCLFSWWVVRVTPEQIAEVAEKVSGALDERVRQLGLAPRRP